ncbi:MAG TPA: ADP-ribosylglycohydrolase family protein [Bacteroidales bacterium]|nr:ADP-ribosylglycohydrolase family protein [Deltaproteobacteria bacterium]HOY73852.1 ADP-ribosylglycohydrolase family protein [Deltaproteobacteria bacterium]HPO40029.1 ADP-ribosylglycohydrolase family protein [Bacteroidales bacterium]
MDLVDRYTGCLLGLACGDAVGTTLEFKPRGSFEPITDMVGGGPFNLEAGQWTDDTSMALCLAESLIEKKGFEPLDQMERYVRWYRTGYLSSTGVCFDIGGTTASALRRFEKTHDPFSGPTDSHSAGNGSLMRLAPVPLFFFPDRDAMIFYAGESSRTTHGAQVCIDACRLFASILYNALSGMDKERVLFDHDEAIVESPAIRETLKGSYKGKKENQIQGIGYVVKSLEAALWCFYETETFKEALLRAANLGDDADTTTAICGQVAGAYYGIHSIPCEWLGKISLNPHIFRFMKRL